MLHLLLGFFGLLLTFFAFLGGWLVDAVFRSGEKEFGYWRSRKAGGKGWGHAVLLVLCLTRAAS
jgi:hypothetical protein